MNWAAVSDDELRSAMQHLLSGRATSITRSERSALEREYTRRFANNSAAPDNVTEHLEAAASPIEVDPTPQASKPKTWRDMSDEEMVAPVTADTAVAAGDLDAYGQRYRQAVSNTLDRGVDRRMAERAAGIPDPDQAAYNAATGLGSPSAPAAEPDYVTVDGVSVRTHPLSDGQSFGGMYTLRALREAKDAAEEQRWLANHRAMIDEENAKYGHYSLPNNSDQLTQAQKDARLERTAVAERQRTRNIMMRNRPGMVALREEQAQRRDFLRRRNMLAGGSNNINGGNVAMFNQLAMMRPEEQIRQLQYALPGGQLLAQVEARQLDQAARLAGDAITGALAGQGQADRAVELRNAQRMENFRVVAGKAATDAGVGYARRDAERALIAAGASLPEREEVLRGLFGPGAGTAEVFPAPLPLPEGHGNPGRMPDGTYPMM